MGGGRRPGGRPRSVWNEMLGAEHRAVMLSARSGRSRAVRAVARRAARVVGLRPVQARARGRRRARVPAPVVASVLVGARARIGAQAPAVARIGAQRAARVPAGARRGARVPVRGPVRAVLAPAPGVVPRSVGLPGRAGASTAGRCSRAACPLGVRRSAGVAGRPSACHLSRPRPGARRPTRKLQRGPPGTRGAGTRCRNRRRCARSP